MLSPPYDATANLTAISDSTYSDSYRLLQTKYGIDTDYNLPYSDIISVMKAADGFFGSDLIGSLHRRLNQFKIDGNKFPAMELMNDHSVGNLIRGFNCSHIIKRNYVADRIHLRIARILLFWYQEHIDLVLKQHINLTTTTLDIIVEEVYKLPKNQPNSRTWNRRKTSLCRHIRIGKRWSNMLNYLGVGTVLICGQDVAKML
jgi:hypothetical protein